MVNCVSTSSANSASTVASTSASASTNAAPSVFRPVETAGSIAQGSIFSITA